MFRIIVIEDDEGLSKGIAFALEKEGYQVFSGNTLQEGYSLWKEKNPDAILLDLNLPDGDGIVFCRKIREVSEVPIIMVTARDLELDEIMGLEGGADDYLTKPFSLSVLKVRLAHILRRSKKECALFSNKITLLPENMKAYKEQEELDLSLTEFKLLKLFLENKGRVLLKEQILSRIWDEDGNFVDENTLPVNISRLRKKIEESPTNPQYIKTVHGMGYLWEEV